PNARGGIRFTALAMALWSSRADLRGAFPAPEGVDGVGFAEWLLESAGREAGFAESHLDPIRKELARVQVEAERGDGQAAPSRLGSFLFRLAWRHRTLIPLR